MMRRLITTGLSPADAAERAKDHTGEISIEDLVDNFEVREELVDTLFRAANALDKPLLANALRNDIAQHGIVSSWTEVIVPLLFLIGDDWEASGSGIEIEHVLSEILKKILLETVASIESPINARPVLLASVGEELHCLAWVGFLLLVTSAKPVRFVQCFVRHEDAILAFKANRIILKHMHD